MPDKRLNGRRSYDMIAHKLTASDYQELLDLNWRRSGENCYYPRNEMTCCPNYSIVCNAIRFKLSRSHRKCINNMNLYLLGSGDESGSSGKKNGFKLNYSRCAANKTCDTATKQQLEDKIQAIILNFEKFKTSTKSKHRRLVRACERKVKLFNLSKEDAIKKVCEKRHERQQQFPHDNQILPLENYLFPEVTIAETRSTGDNVTTSELSKRRKLVIRLVHVDSQESRSLREAEHAIMIKYQKVVHKEKDRDWTMDRYCEFLVQSPLLVEDLKNYKHLDFDGTSSQSHDDCFSRAAPLLSCTENNNKHLIVEPPNLPTRFGTYHCHYYLDNKLIAVGVLDVLPKCITTVYFFYDPDYSFLNLGIYSALVEISLVRRLAQQCKAEENNKLIYYYLGFYVHVCKKMHYKTRFKPSYLLCSKTRQYVRTEICLEKLKDKKFDIFGDKQVLASNWQAVPLEELLKIPIVSPIDQNNRKLYDYLMWLTDNGLDPSRFLIDVYLQTYAQLIGPSLLTKLCLQLNAIHRALRDKHEQS